MVRHKSVKVRVGRYNEDFVIKFLQEFGRIQALSRIKVNSEICEDEIKDSMREDLRPGVQTHDNGNDVKSIALSEISKLEPKIERERSKQELVMLKSILALLDTHRAEVQKLMLSAGGERITEAGKRQLEIETCKLKLAV